MTKRKKWNPAKPVTEKDTPPMDAPPITTTPPEDAATVAEPVKYIYLESQQQYDEAVSRSAKIECRVKGIPKWLPDTWIEEPQKNQRETVLHQLFDIQSRAWEFREVLP